MKVHLAQDHHVHTTFSDDAHSSVAETIAAAEELGLRTLCLTDHVGAETSWVSEYVDTIRVAAADSPVDVLCGVEVTMVDSAGRLDLPEPMPRVDRILIADHQFPGPDGPVAPEEMRRRLAAGETSPESVVYHLLAGMAGAMYTVRSRHPAATPQLAHPFSLLPKMGLSERDIAADQVRFIADTAARTGTLVEANERWGCPSRTTLAVFREAGATIVPSTDSHHRDDVGRYERVMELLPGATR